MGLSFIASLASNPYIWDSVRLLILGTLIEAGRRLCYWFMERFKIQYCITAQFTEGDQSYEWVLLFLTQENVWRRSREFRVNEKNSKRKWGLKLTPELDGNADYVPTYKMPQLFRWKGYWIEVKRSSSKSAIPDHHMQGGYSPSTISITIYTLDMNVLYNFVEETRVRYKEVSRPNVVVHMADMPTYGPGFVWSNVKHKARRPLSSIVLNEGIVDSLVKDAREFIDTEDWYVEAGIPHRRGYLLYGPPGTGKTSTIYALAGELGLEIYALSLSSGFVDDSFLTKAASSIPKHSILLIEDIDCAFPSREDSDDDENRHQVNQFGFHPAYGPVSGRKSAVTLSGLLNVIDGVGSEEGKLFFATTNYIDRLDPALLRPGRIDTKIQYKLATKEQAYALFMRFFGPRTPANGAISSSVEKPVAPASITDLATQFAVQVPQHEFSTAEIQGFLLSCKKDPQCAVERAGEWIEVELGERREKTAREAARKAKAQAKRDERERRQVDSAMAKVGEGFGKIMANGGILPGSRIVAPTPTAAGPLGPVAPAEPISTPVTPSPAYEDTQALEPPSPLTSQSEAPITNGVVDVALDALVTNSAA
ncbi:hypothetical protein E4T56_gene3769 [Termitomyces sp. T112]|nr:hypothetical protein E4T56_gene3769 [Termitomyces sp. T112]KNZ77939.1 Mitochondrial chaperone BCS1 [Termitomyces sp. J132]